MIQENRWQHILGVARCAKKLAEILYPENKTYAEDMFLMGILHDFGYEFSLNGQNHAQIGGDILKRSGYQFWQAVALHGSTDVDEMSDELFILNCADMSVDAKGQNCTFEERLADIANRYGNSSPAYQKSITMANMLKNDIRYLKIKDKL